MTLDTLYNKIKMQNFEIFKMNREAGLHPLSKSMKGYSEDVLTPVNLSGVVTPWNRKLAETTTSDYKLVNCNGSEYFIIADKEWREVLTTFCWQQVRVIGLLNVTNMSVIPQKVYPKGPEVENVIDLAAWKGKEFFKKLIKKVNEKTATAASG